MFAGVDVVQDFHIAEEKAKIGENNSECQVRIKVKF
jgi:hypothetical protein